MLREHEFTTGEVRLNFMVGPANGPPLLFLHGVTRRWQDFLSVLPTLQLRWQVYGLDFRGHGGSGRCPGQYRVVDHVRDARAFLREHVREPAVVYGHSLGALVAAAVAASEPVLVRAVILEDPPAPTLVHGIRQTPYFALFTGMQALAGRELAVPALARELADLGLPAPGGQTMRLGDIRDAVSLRFLARCLQQLDPEVLTPLLQERWLDGYDPEAVHRQVACPALLLRADESCGGMLPPADADRFAHWLADGTRIDFPGVSHLIHWLAPEATLRFVTGFLESL
jgi:pimeloyl-ACP methyl ester carboxylesterase